MWGNVMIAGLAARSRVYVRDESGVSTVWALYWTVIFLVMAGFVIDAANAYRYRIALQATADSSALGAIMSYREPQYYNEYIGGAETDEEIRGREVAKKVALSIMGEKMNKVVVGDSQIVFGDWNGATFNPDADPDDVDAAKVTALRSRANGNELNTLLLNMFGGLEAWDVGAVAIAHYYKELCPQKEGIMAGNTLNLSSGNLFYGDLCLHGEMKVDMQSANDFNDEAVLTYGLDGEVCMGMGNCGEDVVLASNPELDGRMEPKTDLMPDVPEMFEKFKDAIADPVGAMEKDHLIEYIPEALFASVDTETALPTALHTNPATDGADAFRVTTFDGNGTPNGNGGDDFEAYLADSTLWVDHNAAPTGFTENGDPIYPAATKPMQPNTIYEVFGCSGDKTITFRNDWLTDIVFVTDCRVDFASDTLMTGTTILTSWGDPSYDTALTPLSQENDYKGSAAFTGSSGTQIGDGSCEDPWGASKLIAAGDITFGSGVHVNYSQLLTKGDLTIAAQGDGTTGTTAWAWGDVNLTSLGSWQGCDYLNTADQTIPFYYRLVY